MNWDSFAYECGLVCGNVESGLMMLTDHGVEEYLSADSGRRNELRGL